MVDINFLDTISLGKIASWRTNKTSNLIPIALPASDADAVEAIDTMGVVAYVSIMGYFVGTFEEIQSAIASIRNILDGYQYSPSIIKSPYVNTTVSASTYRGNIGFNTGLSTGYLVDTAANFNDWNITSTDKVKNLTTGVVTNIDSQYLNTNIKLDSDIFSAIHTAYAITATMSCKLLSFDTDWALPGINYCRYELSLLQVKDE